MDYVEGTLSQRKEDLISCCEHALYYYGGVPMAIVPDCWHEVIGEKTIADAILDRIVHNAHRIELKGESLRKGRDNYKENGNLN